MFLNNNTTMIKDFFLSTTVILAVFTGASQNVEVQRNNVINNIPETIKAEGYPAEIHHVITEDGYIVEVYRIPYGRNEKTPLTPRPVVFLMHGIGAASNSYLVLGPKYSIAYNLADAGFDVWLGNARGTRFSRRHVSLNPDDPEEKFEFFNFSFEEIGIYDIAAIVDYILEKTNHQQLHYIGHSQGGTVFLVLNSLRPEYNKKFASAHLLAGVGYQEYFPEPHLAALAIFTNTIYRLALSLGIVELFPPNSTDGVTSNVHEYCAGDIKLKEMCNIMGVQQIMRQNEGNYSLQGEGAALKQLAHYGQNINAQLFRRWDYGTIQNLVNYGSRDPPTYDLSLITVNVTMHYTLNDDLLDERDVLAMARDMPNTSARKVARESFTHSDFVTATDVRELVTEYIIEALWNSEAWK